MPIDYSWDAPGHPANRYCRSDHFMYARYGIPITYFSLGYHPHYHMVTDEAQYIDYDHSARVALVPARHRDRSGQPSGAPGGGRAAAGSQRSLPPVRK